LRRCASASTRGAPKPATSIHDERGALRHRASPVRLQAAAIASATSTTTTDAPSAQGHAHPSPPVAFLLQVAMASISACTDAAPSPEHARRHASVRGTVHRFTHSTNALHAASAPHARCSVQQLASSHAWHCADVLPASPVSSQANEMPQPPPASLDPRSGDASVLAPPSPAASTPPASELFVLVVDVHAAIASSAKTAGKARERERETEVILRA
jgi:hypothetical protein